MRRYRHLLACSILSSISSIGIACASRNPAPAPEVTDRPAGVVAGLEYMQAIQIDEAIFQAPPGHIRVFTTTRPRLDAARRPASDDFDNGAHPLFYLGSDDDWDYYYLADHAFGLFHRVSREYNTQDQRMPLTGDSLAWREVKGNVSATTKPAAATSKP
jgi:hypothetical protein